MKKILFLSTALFVLVGCASQPGNECSDNGFPLSGQDTGMIAGGIGGAFLANGRTSNGSANTANTILGAAGGAILGNLGGAFLDDNSKMKCRVAMQQQQIQRMQMQGNSGNFQLPPQQQFFPPQQNQFYSPQQGNNYYKPIPGFFPNTRSCPDGRPGQPAAQDYMINGQINTVPGVMCN